MKLSGLLLCSVLAWPVAYAALRADRPEPQAQVYTVQAAPAPVAPGPVVAKVKSPVDVVKDEATNLYMLQGIAFAAARICNLRSEAWNYSLDIGIGLYLSDFAHKTISNYAQASATLESVAGVMARSRAYYATRCGELINSPIMDKLDMMQNRLTGGYH